MKTFLFLLLSTICTNSFCQEKEILILGTMHTVPEIVKDSYKPLLEFSKNYKPDAIYVEYVSKTDTVSLKYDAPKFLKKSDSLKKIFISEPERFKKLKTTRLNEFTQNDFEFMTNTYLKQRDNANYSFFKYLSKYGINGSKEPLRHENEDLTAKLAIALDLKYLYAMDDQQTNEKYHIAWKKCNEIGEKNGDNEINQQLGKEQYDSAIEPALAGKLGEHTNKPASINRLHLLSSFRYVKNKNSSCSDGTKFWDERNLRMAKNIAEQVKQESNNKNIVIVGAAHVIGLKEALEKNYPELKVRLMHD